MNPTKQGKLPQEIIDWVVGVNKCSREMCESKEMAHAIHGYNKRGKEIANRLAQLEVGIDEDKAQKVMVETFPRMHNFLDEELIYIPKKIASALSTQNPITITIPTKQECKENKS